MFGVRLLFQTAPDTKRTSTGVALVEATCEGLTVGHGSPVVKLDTVLAGIDRGHFKGGNKHIIRGGINAHKQKCITVLVELRLPRFTDSPIGREGRLIVARPRRKFAFASFHEKQVSKPLANITVTFAFGHFY